MSTRERKKTADYLVGYGRPPKRSRFKKGQSGNPTGRRRYTQTGRARQLINQEFFRPVTVRDRDKVVRIPALQAMLRSLLLTAIKQGKGTAARDVLAMLKMVDAEGNGNPTGFLSHEEALAELERLETLAANTPTRIVRTIVDPNQEIDLNQLNEPDALELERLLFKARKTTI